MISVNLIERWFRAGQHEALLAGLTSNGLDLPLPLRIRLSQLVSAVIALGLRRLAEITYGPTRLSDAMTDALLTLQDGDGSFEHDPLATAAAAAALGRMIREQQLDCTSPVVTAREHAMASLVCMQNDDGLFGSADDRTIEDRALVSAFILYLLAGDAEFRASVRFADLMNWFDEHENELPEHIDPLWQLARVESQPAELFTAAIAA